MRQFVFIAAMVLASATAQAGGSRSLTLASNDQPAAAAQPKSAEQKVVEQKPVEQKAPVEAPAATDAPKFTARPAPVDAVSQVPKTEAPKAETTTPVAEKTTQTAKVEKPNRRRETIEARVIRELHRHGVYW